MADITFSATLDDKAVSKGLDSIAEKAKQSTQKVEQSFSNSGNASDKLVSRFAGQIAAFVSIQRVISFLSAAMVDYGKRNIDVASKIDKLSDAATNFKDSYIRNITPVLDDMADMVAQFDDAQRKMYRGIDRAMNSTTTHGGESPEFSTGLEFMNEDAVKTAGDIAEDELLKQEKMQKELAEQKIISTERQRLLEKEMRQENRIYDADLLKNQSDYVAKLAEIAAKAKEQKLSGSTVDALQRMAVRDRDIANRKAIDDEKARKLAFEQSMKAGADQIAQEEEKERQEQKSWELAQQQLQIEQEKSEIESQSLKNSIDGNKDVVAIMQAKLQLHERLNAIQDNEKIDSQEKEYLATLARTNALESIVHTLENPTMSGAEKRASSVSLASGAGAIGRAAVFGDRVYSDPPGLKEAREQLNVAKQSLKHLSEIALWAKDMATGGDSTIARFGL